MKPVRISSKKKNCKGAPFPEYQEVVYKFKFQEVLLQIGRLVLTISGF